MGLTRHDQRAIGWFAATDPPIAGLPAWWHKPAEAGEALDAGEVARGRGRALAPS